MKLVTIVTGVLGGLALAVASAGPALGAVPRWRTRNRYWPPTRTPPSTGSATATCGRSSISMSASGWNGYLARPPASTSSSWRHSPCPPEPGSRPRAPGHEQEADQPNRLPAMAATLDQLREGG